MYSFEDDILSLEQVVQPFLDDPSFFFVNVGANDGVLNDPIYPLARRHGWRGIAIEPVPHVYEQLVTNYRDLPGVITENLAVSPDPHATRATFWHVEPGSGSVEHVVQQIGSLSRERVLEAIEALRERADQLPREARVVPGYEPAATELSRHEGALIEDDLPSHLRAVEVDCIPFDRLMERHGVDHINFLNIDAEGLDYDIFCSIDLDRFCPDVLCIESWDFTAEQQQHFHDLIGQHGLRPRGQFALFSMVYSRAV